MPERSQVNMVSQQMQFMGVPITDEQRTQLLNIMIEEDQRNPRPTPADGTPPEEMFAQSMKWQDERDRNFLDRAKSVLTREQYERYRDYQAWQSDIRNNGLRNLRPGQTGMIITHGATFTSSEAPAPKE